jgi:hypothetical protein
VSLQGDQVVLDLSAVIDQVKQRLVDRGLTIVANIPVPNVDKQIVLLDAPQLRQARSIYAFANPIARWLILVVALLFLAAVALARRRPRMVVTVGAVLVANALLLAFALSVARQLFVDHLSGTVFGPASSVFYDTLLSYLERGWRVMAWLGLIVLLAGLFAGPNRVGTVVRTDVRNGLEGVGAKLADGPVATSGRWVRANIRWLRVAVCLVGAVILLWGVDVSVARLGWSFLFVVVVLAVLQVLVGAGRSTTVGGPGSAGEPESQDSEAGGGPTPAAASAS